MIKIKNSTDAELISNAIQAFKDLSSKIATLKDEGIVGLSISTDCSELEQALQEWQTKDVLGKLTPDHIAFLRFQALNYGNYDHYRKIRDELVSFGLLNNSSQTKPTRLGLAATKAAESMPVHENMFTYGIFNNTCGCCDEKPFAITANKIDADELRDLAAKLWPTQKYVVKELK
jgi:hypothetical protein